MNETCSRKFNPTSVLSKLSCEKAINKDRLQWISLLHEDRMKFFLVLFFILKYSFGYEVLTKQTGLNRYVLEVKNSTKSLAIVCRYHTQSVVIQTALWTKQLHKNVDIVDKCKGNTENTTQYTDWTDKTQIIRDTCKSGTCVLLAPR